MQNDLTFIKIPPMPRKINRLQDARPILEKIHTDLVGTINSGFADWLRIRAFSNTLDGGLVNYIYVACWIGNTLEWVDEFGKYSAELAVLDFDAKENTEV